MAAAVRLPVAAPTLFEWRESSPGEWQRSVDALGTFTLFVTRRHPICRKALSDPESDWNGLHASGVRSQGGEMLSVTYVTDDLADALAAAERAIIRVLEMGRMHWDR